MSRGRQIVRLKLRQLSAQAHNLILDWESSKLYSQPSDFPCITSGEIFGNDLPLSVEIGPGSGEFLCDTAKSQPRTNFLGIEVSHRAGTACAALAADQELTNLRVLRADFKLLQPLLPTAGWVMVYLHFPDPQHKLGDVKRRIFDQAFLGNMANTLIPGGKISVASDKPDFFFRMLEIAEADPRFKVEHGERYLKGFEVPVKSRFQQFWERKGVQPLRFILRKK